MEEEGLWVVGTYVLLGYDCIQNRVMIGVVSVCTGCTQKRCTSWMGCGIAGVILYCRAILRFAMQTQTSERYASRLHVDYAGG